MNKKIIYILIAILIITGGVFYYISNKPQEMPNSEINLNNKNNNSSSSKVEEESRFVNKIIKDDLYIFEDNSLGFSFLYPESWGEAMPVSSIEGFDTGRAVFVSFVNKSNISFSIFEDNFSQGVSEGSLSYFDSNLNLENSTEQIKNFLVERNHFDILSLEKIEIAGKNGIKILGNRGYIKNQGSVSWLMPNFLNNQERKFNVMGVFSFGDFIDNNYTLDEINTFLGSSESLEYTEKINEVLMSMN